MTTLQIRSCTVSVCGPCHGKYIKQISGFEKDTAKAAFLMHPAQPCAAMWQNVSSY